MMSLTQAFSSNCAGCPPGDGILKIVEENPRVEAGHTTEQAPADTPKLRSGRPRGSFLPEVTGVKFPLARRGYDRKRVDDYVERVSSIVVELESRGLSRNPVRERANVGSGLADESALEASGSPDAVIERALADVGEETSAILRRALAAAEEIVAEANTEAQQLTARVEGDTRQTREEADRYREQATLDADKIESQANSKAAQTEAAAQQTREETNRYAERVKPEAEEILAQASAEAERLARERHRLSEDLRNLAEDLRRTSDALENTPSSGRPHQGVDSDSAASR